MPRPSQCISCYLYEGCMHPESKHCAERLERDEIERRTKEREVPKSPQQYSTPDGSIWEHGQYGQSQEFLRVASPDGSHENDAHPQSLEKVLKHWGPLSLHDPYAEELVHLVTTLTLVPHHSKPQEYAERIQKQFRVAGLRLILESELE